MTENRGQGRRDVSHRDSPVRDDPPPDPAVSDTQLSRTRIRQRWEFASVLNFFHVFEPLIGGDLRISAEEIETALITPNDDLARLHVALLKGIPPVSRNMTDGDSWVTVVCKKLAPWWPWVAEGENPIKVDHGKEIQRYKTLDPITRMVIMKALCEVRVQQDDVLRYITDELKKGTKITTFRKERIGGVDNRVSYWHDGDPVIGHRLYKEVVQVESKPKPRGKGRASEPTNAYQWETLATELEEFQKLSDNLSSSKSNAEAVLGEMIKTEIVPVLQELQKKKERALKRQQREVLQLNGFLNYSRVGVSRSCRERKPVCYTFDDYDRSIDEAIHISKKLKTTRSKDNVVQDKPVTNQTDALGGRGKDYKEDSETDDIHESLADVEDYDYQNDNNEDGDSDEKDENSKHQSHNDEDGDYNEKDENSKHQSDDDEDDDYDEKDENSEHHSENHSDYDSDEKDEGRGENKIEDDDDNDDFTSSDADEESPKLPRNQKNTKTKAAMGIRRSKRFGEPTKGPAQMKKRLRQRPTRNSAQIVSDSEGDSSQDTEKQTEIVPDSETEGSAASGDESQEDSGDASNE